MRTLLVSIWAALAVMASSCSADSDLDEGQPMERFELIVLAAPVTDDPYYADVADEIFAFHVGFAQTILANGDEVLILSDSRSAPAYRRELGPERVLVAPQQDIWARDFSIANPSVPVMFRYTAEGQGGGAEGQRDADGVQDVFYAVAAQAGLQFAETDLLNDGGNWVEDGYGSVVVSRKFLRDNALSEEAARRELRAVTGATHIAIIEADEQGGLEHADGVVAFVGPNTLIINSYPEDADYAAALRSSLEVGLPDIRIHEIVTPYDGSEIYDERFGSACGLYTNALVTENRVYLPQFGIAEDAIAITQVRAATSLDVVPVSSSGVCFMGGGVRCMSWQLRGENAERLLTYAAAQAR